MDGGVDKGVALGRTQKSAQQPHARITAGDFKFTRGSGGVLSSVNSSSHSKSNSFAKSNNNNSSNNNHNNNILGGSSGSVSADDGWGAAEAPFVPKGMLADVGKSQKVMPQNWAWQAVKGTHSLMRDHPSPFSALLPGFWWNLQSSERCCFNRQSRALVCSVGALCLAREGQHRHAD